VTERAPAFNAVIFDMDGVLTDSEPAFYAAFNDVLARYGKHIAMHDYEQLIGSATSESWRRVLEITRLDVPLDAIIDEYEAPLMARLRESRPPLPHARELIETLRASNVPVALCTASFSRWADAILGGAGLAGLFDAVSTADMVDHTKPDPAPYLLAAKLLGVAPEQCVAVEDSAHGLTSALSAGMHVIQLRATATAAPLMPGVARTIDSLADFPIDLVAPRT
jgi:HAD superfamily hydrolase (TIGR01509 family)